MAGQVLDRALTENETLTGVNDDYATKYGFSDVEDYIFKAERGLDLVPTVARLAEASAEEGLRL